MKQSAHAAAAKGWKEEVEASEIEVGGSQGQQGRPSTHPGVAMLRLPPLNDVGEEAEEAGRVPEQSLGVPSQLRFAESTPPLAGLCRMLHG